MYVCLAWHLTICQTHDVENHKNHLSATSRTDTPISHRHCHYIHFKESADSVWAAHSLHRLLALAAQAQALAPWEPDSLQTAAATNIDFL